MTSFGLDDMSSGISLDQKQPVVLLQRISDKVIQHYASVGNQEKVDAMQFTEDWQSCVSESLAKQVNKRRLSDSYEGNSSDPDTEPYASDGEITDSCTNFRTSAAAAADSTTASGRNTPASDGGHTSDSGSRNASSTASPDTNAPHLGALKRSAERAVALELDIYSSLNVIQAISDSEDPKDIVSQYAKLFEKCVNILHEINPRARDLVLKAFSMKQDIIKNIFNLLRELTPGKSGCAKFVSQVESNLRELLNSEEDDNAESCLDNDDPPLLDMFDVIEGAKPKSIEHIISVVNQPKLEELLGLTFEKRVVPTASHGPPPYHSHMMRSAEHLPFYRGPGRPMHRHPGSRSPAPRAPPYRPPSDIRAAQAWRAQMQQQQQQQQLRHQQMLHHHHQQQMQQAQIQQQTQQQQHLKQQAQQQQGQRLQQQQRFHQPTVSQMINQHQRVSSSPAQVMADMGRLANASTSVSSSGRQQQQRAQQGRHGMQIPVSVVQQQMQQQSMVNSQAPSRQSCRLPPQTTLTPAPPPLVPSSTTAHKTPSTSNHDASKKSTGPISITLPSGISITPIETAPPKEKSPPVSAATSSKSSLQIIPVQKSSKAEAAANLLAKLNPGITLTPIASNGSNSAKVSPVQSPAPVSVSKSQPPPLQSAASMAAAQLQMQQRSAAMARSNGMAVHQQMTASQRGMNWIPPSGVASSQNRQQSYVSHQQAAMMQSRMQAAQRQQQQHQLQQQQQAHSAWPIPTGPMHAIPSNGIIPGYMVQTLQGPPGTMPHQLSHYMVPQQRPHFK